MSRSAIFAPLLAQQDVLGVIEVGSTRRLGYFTPEEQATLHHLANQVAASLKLEEQQAVREQLFRSEKLAATGQLISGVASDLRAPLERIQEVASSLIGADGSSQIERGLKQLTAEAQRAAEIVSRLVSFARPAETGARLVDVNALGSGLLQFREPEWKTLGLRVQNHLSPEPALVLGVQGQIEEVFLNLLVAAEQAAARSTAKTLEVSSSVIAGRVVVEIHYPEDGAEAATVESNLDVCRAIVQNHGGELRARSQSGGMSFDVDLRLAPAIDRRRLRMAPGIPGGMLRRLLVDWVLGRSGSCWGCFQRAGIAWFRRGRRKRLIWRTGCASMGWCGHCGRAARNGATFTNGCAS